MSEPKKTKQKSEAKSDSWAKDLEPFAYLAVKKTKDGIRPPIATGAEEYVREVLKRWEAGEPPKSEAEEPREPETSPDTSQEIILKDALTSGVSFAVSQAHLIAVTSMAPWLFEEVHIVTKILDPITKSLAPVEDNATATIYALTADQFAEFEKGRKNLANLRLGVAAMPNATLMSLVATFDALIVDLVAKMLRMSKGWMVRGDRKLPFEKIAGANSIEEIVDEAIAEEIYQFSRGSHDEQAKYIETNFGVSIRGNWRRWPDYIEVFERRNLIAHGEKNFNKRYVSICKDSGHKGCEKLLGDNIEVRPTYLRQCLDVLTEFAILFPFAVWRKMSDEEEEKAFQQLNETAYDLILNERYSAAERILEFALLLTKVKVPARTIQMLTINRASALRHMGNEEQANVVLDGIDWSASSDFFKICMWAVRGNEAEVATLLPKFANSDELNAPTFKQWPCFKFVRGSEVVRDAFKKAFGEPLDAPAAQTTSNQLPDSLEVRSNDEDTSKSSDGETLH